MMIRSRLKLLAAGGILLVLVAAVLVGWGYWVMQQQQVRYAALDQLQTDSINLNVITLDQLHRVHHTLSPSLQWSLVYNNLGGEITNTSSIDLGSRAFLLKSHHNIGERFNSYVAAKRNCEQDSTVSFSDESCQELLGRLKTQVRLEIQNLHTEISKAGELNSHQAQQQNAVFGGLLLLPPILMSLLTVALVLPMSRSIGTGLTRMLEASKRFSQGDFSYRLTVDSQDEMGMLAKTYNDMAENREASETALDTVFQTLPDLFFRMASDGTILDYRAQKTSNLYVPPETFLGRRMQDVLPAGVGHIFAARIQQVHEEGTLLTFEYDLSLASGGRHFEARLISLPDNDKELIAIVRDTTMQHEVQNALSESEQRFRTIFEQAAVGFALIEAGTGRFLRINKRYAEMVGYSIEELSGELTFQEITHPDDLPLNLENLEKLQAGGLANFTMEKRYFHKDGSVVWVNLAVSSTSASEDQPEYYIAIMEDITGRKHTEEALRRSQKMEAIGQLSGGIAHDFNNILGIIIGNLSFLKRYAEGDEKAVKWAETANKAALRAADLTRQLLGFSRNQAQTTMMTDINQVIDDMKNLISRSETPEVEIDYKLADNLWQTDIDPGDFQDALINLILNARDAMPDGGRLTIETANKELDSTYTELNPSVTAGHYVELAVSDNGTGILKKHVDRVFDPFFTTKPVGKGTGLGLSMVFGFAQRSKGHIKIYSEPDIGTTVRCYLPRQEKVNVEQSLSDAEQQQIPKGSEVILVVDDEEDLLKLAQQFLEELGYIVVTATDAKQALDVLASNSSIDLLFSDVVMPGGINGYELAERAEADYPGIKVLLTSGYTSKSIINNGQVRFKTSLLTKPYNQKTMAKRIRHVLDKK